MVQVADFSPIGPDQDISVSVVGHDFRTGSIVRNLIAIHDLPISYRVSHSIEY